MAMGSAISSFTLDVEALGWTAQDLQRPESVVAEPDGTLWASDGRGGVTRIDPDGGQKLLIALPMAITVPHSWFTAAALPQWPAPSVPPSSWWIRPERDSVVSDGRPPAPNATATSIPAGSGPART